MTTQGVRQAGRAPSSALGEPSLVRVGTGMRSVPSARGTAAAAIAGGLLWIAYGIFELLTPFGLETAYDDSRGYEVISDRLLHITYSLPGALAVLLSAVALLGLLRGGATVVDARLPCGLGWLAVACGGLAVVGVAIGFDPLFTGPRVFGTLALGFGTLLAARALTPRDRRRHLALLGVGGIALLPLWPLIYAVQLLPAAAGAAVIACFGLGWIALGVRLRAR